jgi:O-antigen/teichoic acid export membrane protein
LINTVSYPLFVFATTPYFIKHLGAEQYGIWVLINTTTQLMGIFNLGLGDTAIKYISNFRVDNQDDEIRKTVSAIWGIGILVFFLAVALGVGLLIAISYTSWFNISPGLRTLAGLSALVGFNLFGIKFLEQIILSVLQGYERYDIASKLSLASRISILAGNFILIFLGYSLLEVLLSSVAILVTFLVVEIALVRKMYPVIRFKASYERSTLRSIFQFGFWSWAQSLLAIITTQTDKFIVAFFSGVQVLTYYSIGSLITTQVHGVFTSISAWVFPAVSKKTSDGSSLYSFYRKSELLLLAFGFGAIITFLFVEKPLLVLWLDEDTYAKSIRFIKVFLYYNLFLLIHIIPYWFLNGTGNVKHNTAAEFATKILNICGMLICYKIFGTIGLIWGLVFSMFFATPIRLTFVYRHALNRKNFSKGLEQLIAPALIVLAFETDDLIYRVSLLLLFLITFYFIYVRTFLKSMKISTEI